MKPLKCDGCTACCETGTIVLHPALGDDPSRYDCELVEGIGYVLKKKPDGTCIYLGDGSCTIWGWHPGVCKAFDCRVYVASRWMQIDPYRNEKVVKAGLERADQDV
jgi:Fe-S-cluster containining protein